MNLTPGQWKKFQRAVQQLYCACGLDEFPMRLIEAATTLVDNDIACYTEVEPDKQRVRNVAQHHSAQLEALLPVLGELQLQHPRIAAFVEDGEERALRVSDYLSVRDWHKRDVYQHFYGALNIEEQLGFVVPADNGVQLGFVFNRGRRSFTDDDRLLLEMLRPHVLTAYHNAQVVSRLRGGEQDKAPAPSTHGVVHLRADGTVWYYTERSADLLQRYWPDQAATWQLPDDVRTFVRDQVRLARGGDGDAAVRVVDCVRPFGILRLRLLDKDGADGFLLLLEERVRSVRDEIESDLPKRLRRLVPLLLEGESEKRIAVRLHLSPHTVHEYVKQMYRHLQVSSRAEFMARFLRA